LSAPHGGFDWNTEHIAKDVAEQLGWSSLIAIGFRTLEKPINVNRPTEGVKLPPEQELHTADALIVFQKYQNLVKQLDPQFYVELHGATLISNRIEIALNGVNKDIAREIKSIFEEEARRLNLNISIGVEGLDTTHYQAPAAKKWGVLGQMSPGLHIELSPELRGRNLSPSVELLTYSLSRIKKLF
jgi:hypothetical protein